MYLPSRRRKQGAFNSRYTQSRYELEKVMLVDLESKLEPSYNKFQEKYKYMSSYVTIVSPCHIVYCMKSEKITVLK